MWLKQHALFGVEERARIMPFAGFILLMMAEPGLKAGFAMVGLSPQWSYVVRTLVAVGWLACYRQHYPELWQLPTLRQCLWALASGLLVFAVWILPYPEWLGNKLMGSFAPPAMQSYTDIFLLTFRWAGSALVVPVIEELFWRSFLMRKLDDSDFNTVSPMTVTTYAVIISSVLFAVEHQLWFAGLVAGLVYAWLYRRFEVLWVAVLAHMTTNAVLGLWVIYAGQWRYW